MPHYDLPFPVIIPDLTTDPDAALEVARQRNRWREAIEARDVDAIMRFYIDDIYSYDLMPAIEDGQRLLAFEGSDIWRENWIDFLATFDPGLKVSFDSLTVYLSGGLATVRGLTLLDGSLNGASVTVWARETNVLRLVDGEWLVIHDHVSVPVDLASSRALLDLQPRA
jgi:ketosteroid isomerase-like protein